MTPEARRSYLLEYGSQSNAYFHNQEDLRYFHLEGVGFVSYHLQRGWGRPVPLVFLKPLCADGQLRHLLAAFLAELGPRAVFMGMDAQAASVLGELGFSVNEFGVEFTVPVQTHRVEGRAMRHLRSVRNYASRGVEVKELAQAQAPLEETRRVSDQWLGQRRVSRRELRFLTRPPQFGEDWGVRKFYAFKEGKLVGFVFFDPFFRGGRCIGYCANILRCIPDPRPPGILDFVILQAMARFREEGIQSLALGVAPLHGLEPCPGEDRLLRWCGQALYRWGGPLYNFRDLAYHKSLYRGQAQKVYFCKRGIGILATFLLSLRATNVLGGP